MPTRVRAQYAFGSRAWGQCQRCGDQELLRKMVTDGHIRGLLVCRECYEPRHPQESLVDVTDPQSLRRPAPELDENVAGFLTDPAYVFTVDEDGFVSDGHDGAFDDGFDDGFDVEDD